MTALQFETPEQAKAAATRVSGSFRWRQVIAFLEVKGKTDQKVLETLTQKLKARMGMWERTVFRRPLDFLKFSPSDAPLGRKLSTSLRLPKNPYRAQSASERRTFAKYLQDLLKKIPEFQETPVRAEGIRDGTVVLWKGCGLLAIEGIEAARISKGLDHLQKWPLMWTYMAGRSIIVVFSESRNLLMNLVERVQDKLGIPRRPPPLSLESLRFDSAMLQEKWKGQDVYGQLKLPLHTEKKAEIQSIIRAFPLLQNRLGEQVKQVYCTTAKSAKGTTVLWLVATEFVSTDGARMEAGKLRANRDPVRTKVLRWKNVVAVLGLLGDKIAEGERKDLDAVLERLRERMGL